MRKFLLLIILYCSTYAVSNAQYYINLGDNTGVNVDQFHASLDTAAKRLVQSFPSEFQDSFRVFSTGFYLHSDHFEGGQPTVFGRFCTEAASQSKYYLLIGRQSDESGVCKQYWISLKLPTHDEFSCLDLLSVHLRDNIEQQIQTRANLLVQSLESTASRIVEPSKEGMLLLKEFVLKYVECCDPGIQQNQCTACIDYPVDLLTRMDYYQISYEPVYIENDSDYVSIEGLSSPSSARSSFVSNLNIDIRFPDNDQIVSADSLVATIVDNIESDQAARFNNSISTEVYLYKYPRDCAAFESVWEEYKSSSADLALFISIVNVDDEWGVIGFEVKLRAPLETGTRSDDDVDKVRADEWEGVAESIQDYGGACGNLAYTYLDYYTTRFVDDGIASFIHNRIEGNPNAASDYYYNRKIRTTKSLNEAQSTFAFYFAKEYVLCSIDQTLVECAYYGGLAAPLLGNCAFAAKVEAFANICNESIHTVLDACGTITPICDGVNFFFYIAEYNLKAAGLSAVSIIPVVGDEIQAAKLGGRLRLTYLDITGALEWGYRKLGKIHWVGGRSKLSREFLNDNVVCLLDNLPYSSVTHESHHLTPWAFVNRKAASYKQELTERLARVGWHPSNTDINGMVVPKKLGAGNDFVDGEVVDGLFHGNHPKYNDWVGDALDKINNQYSDEQLYSAMTALKNTLIERITEAYTKNRKLNLYFEELIAQGKLYIPE